VTSSSAYTGFVDSALEASVAGSFTGLGYRLRKRLYPWEVLKANAMQGKTVVITGGTSGLGEHATLALAKLGAHVTMVARNASKASNVCARLRELSGSTRIDAVEAEMGSLRAVRKAAEELQARHTSMDVLIHNAGALDATYAESEEGIEQTIASQVVGPYLLTELLRSNLARTSTAAPSRVLWVASGGMYSEALDVHALGMRPADYDGVTAYARAKRAQVTLAELMAARYQEDNIRVHSMHPGWADTPGVARSLPMFRALLGPLLRSPEEGSDTLVWLAASDGAPLGENGKFWHDRAPRAIHRMGKTKRSDTAAERSKLMAYLERVTK
jgi:dehydrogenase/reductase SDR family member 12